MARRLENAFALEKQRRADIQQPRYAPQNPGLDSIGGLRVNLASERKRRTHLEAEVNRLRAGEAEQGRANAEVVSLRAELAGERNRNRALRSGLERAKEETQEDGPSQAEVDTLEAQLKSERQRRQTLEAELARLSKGREGNSAATPELARLRQQLDQERRRRLEVEKAWTRLREETSVPALADTVTQAELLAVKQELVETRRALDAERAARQKAEEQTSSVAAVAAPDANTRILGEENTKLRDRVSTLQRERDALKRAITELTAETPADGADDFPEE